MTPQEPTRRTFIAGMCGALAAAIGATTPTTEAQAAPAIKKLADGRASVAIKGVPAFKKNGGVLPLGDVQGNQVALVRVNATTYRAFVLACTHQGVSVVPTGSTWACPAHGSKFKATTGAAVQGPATKPLKQLPVTLKAGVVTVG